MLGILVLLVLSLIGLVYALLRWLLTPKRISSPAIEADIKEKSAMLAECKSSLLKIAGDMSKLEPNKAIQTKAPNSGLYSDALLALKTLGYTEEQSKAAINKALNENKAHDVASLVSAVLRSF